MQLPSISIAPAISSQAPVRLGLVLSPVKVVAGEPALDREFTEMTSRLHQQFAGSSIGQIPAIAAARSAYKSFGKDPSRYRPSAEALSRRIKKGEGLYRINNVVDLLNLLSLQSGISIGGYDFSQISGAISLDLGKEGEPYEAIGRGAFNIHQLPILRDERGAFGCPTSDSVRTAVQTHTDTFLMVFFDFEPSGSKLTAWLGLAKDYLVKYASAPLASVQTATMPQ